MKIVLDTKVLVSALPSLRLIRINYQIDYTG